MIQENDYQESKCARKSAIFVTHEAEFVSIGKYSETAATFSPLIAAPMNDFDKRALESADEQYGRMRALADVDNSCYGHATELAASLLGYIERNTQDVQFSRAYNVITLKDTNGRTLEVSTHDHRTYEIMRPGSKDIRDRIRSNYLTRVDERRMMDEVLEWLVAANL